MKIWVYAISKNERQFCERFMASCAEADGVSVLDTGSEDGTAERLIELGADVGVRKFTPWRFDFARNAALDMVPEDVDVCVSLDLDEVLAPGWRKALEAAWTQGVTRARYTYVWSHAADGADGVTFFADKIHARHGYKWRYPVHEILVSEWPETQVVIPDLRVDHWPDAHKSRASYLPLLELAVREDPANDRNTHYLGREYMFHGRWGAAMETLMKHLALPTATWAAERAASMRYIARCCDALGDWRSAVHWLERAADEAPTQREAPYELATLYYRRSDWALCRYWAMRTQYITERDYNYTSEPECWGPEPYDLEAIANWNLGHYDEAVSAARKALELAPDDKRLRRNLEIIQASAKEGERHEGRDEFCAHRRRAESDSERRGDGKPSGDAPGGCRDGVCVYHYHNGLGAGYGERQPDVRYKKQLYDYPVRRRENALTKSRYWRGVLVLRFWLMPGGAL